jgi:uncharacterized protein with HEPN domain
MFDRKPSAYIKDIITSCEHLLVYTNDLNFDEFASDFMVVEACLYNIQVIGEAITKIPDDIKKSEIQIPWTLIKGMRNRLIHEYFGTDLQIVWNVIRKEIPSLKPKFQEIYERLINAER